MVCNVHTRVGEKLVHDGHAGDDIVQFNEQSLIAVDTDNTNVNPSIQFMDMVNEFSKRINIVNAWIASRFFL